MKPKAPPVYAVCSECAQKRGWVPVPFPVGVFQALCEDCGESRPCRAARDYRYDTERNPNGR
jgi:hypothetical protein